MEKVFEKINLLWAAFACLMAQTFGAHWFLFAAFLGLNAVDYITGVWKAKWGHTESSVKGLKGVMKKLGYWIIIAIAFFLSMGFIEIGHAVGIDLGFLNLIGWFVLCTLIINEIRSILENLVEMGVEVPAILTKGLEVAQKLIENQEGTDNKKE